MIQRLLGDAYWPIYRFVRWRLWNPINPVRRWRQARAFWQRGRRGWADEDTWSLMDYLSRVIGESLVHLANTVQGAPLGFVRDDEWGPEFVIKDVDAVHTRWVQWLRDRSEDFLQYAADVDEERLTRTQREALLARMRTVFDYWEDLWD